MPATDLVGLPNFAAQPAPTQPVVAPVPASNLVAPPPIAAVPSVVPSTQPATPPQPTTSWLNTPLKDVGPNVMQAVEDFQRGKYAVNTPSLGTVANIIANPIGAGAQALAGPPQPAVPPQPVAAQSATVTPQAALAPYRVEPLPGTAGGPQIMPTGGGPRREQWMVGQKVHKAFEEGFKAEQGAAVENSRLLGEQLSQQQAAIFDSEQELASQAQAVKAAEQRRQETIDDASMRFQEATNDIANTKIDPGRFWANKSTGEKIATGIGLFFGGIAQGLLKTPSNQVLDNLNKAIQNDIDAQKSNYNISHDTAEAAKTAYGMALQKTGDERQADAIAHAGLLDKIAMDIKARAAGYQNAQVQAATNDLLAKIEMDKAKYLSSALAYVQPGGGTGHLIGEVGVDPSLLIKNPDGSVSMANDKLQAEKINATRTFVKEIKGLQDQYAKILDENPRLAFVPGSAPNMQLEAIRAAGAPLMSKATDQGVLRREEWGPTAASIGLNATAWGSVTGGNKATLAIGRKIVDTMAGRADSEQASTMKLQSTTVLDPRTGQVQERYYYAGPKANTQAVPVPVQRKDVPKK
jgi:hypothetical protein